MDNFVLAFCNIVLKRCHNCNHKIFHCVSFILQIKNLNCNFTSIQSINLDWILKSFQLDVAFQNYAIKVKKSDLNL